MVFTWLGIDGDKDIKTNLIAVPKGLTQKKATISHLRRIALQS
jgi:hypothetical protein